MRSEAAVNLFNALGKVHRNRDAPASTHKAHYGFASLRQRAYHLSTTFYTVVESEPQRTRATLSTARILV